MNGQVFRRRAEQFARLADLASDRPGADVARQLTADAEAVHLVTLTRTLRGLPIGAGPDPEFRDRLRQRLVAVASVQPPAPANRDATASSRAAATPRTTRAGSPRLAFLAGLAAALVLVTALTVLASYRALPGDTLYALKRHSEQVELALERNPQERGLKELSLAQTRLAEIGQLIARGTGTAPGQPGGSAADTGLLAQALADMDKYTREGAAQVTEYAVQHRSDQALAELARWTAAQQAAVAGMRSRLPEPARTQADGSLALLTQLATRVQGLHRDLPCGCLDRTGQDALGPKPCPSCQVPRSPAPQRTGSRAPRPAATSPPPGGLPSERPGTSPSPTAQTSQPPSTAPAATIPTTSAPGLPSVPLPTATPAPLPSSAQNPDGSDPVCEVLGVPVIC
jgi:hypothetical protein